MMVEGSNSDLPPMELVCSGSVAGGSVPSGAGIGRLGMVDGACVFGSAAAGLLDWSLGGIWPVGGASGNRNSMAVCATPTTMMATLAAISSVFRSFITFLPRESAALAPSSIASGGGIVEGVGAGFAAGSGGNAGAGAGAWTCGSATTSFVAFLNGHLSQAGDLRPSDFGT